MSTKILYSTLCLSTIRCVSPQVKWEGCTMEGGTKPLQCTDWTRPFPAFPGMWPQWPQRCVMTAWFFHLCVHRDVSLKRSDFCIDKWLESLRGVQEQSIDIVYGLLWSTEKKWTAWVCQRFETLQVGHYLAMGRVILCYIMELVGDIMPC